MRKEIEITTEYITLGQLLKFAGIIRSGALAKEYLVTNEVYVNEELEARRGRKLYKGDVVSFENQKIKIEKF